MNRLRRRQSRSEPLRGTAVDAALRALSGDAGASTGKRALTGTRAVATGAALYAAVRAAFVGGRFVHARRAPQQAARGQSDGHPAGPDPRGQRDEDTGEVASSDTTTPRPKRASERDDDPQPSLVLPNQRWPRLARERR